MNQQELIGKSSAGRNTACEQFHVVRVGFLDDHGFTLPGNEKLWLG
jgi:hypothetical protein